MANQFTGTPQIKTRTAVLVFVKGASAPVVLYVENPQELFDEIQQLIKTPSGTIIDKTANGPIRRFCVPASQISAVAMQDEQYV
ncbi:hypothetical protein KBA27_04240 [bacterium]|nr:hypothetical protein [bacterium]